MKKTLLLIASCGAALSGAAETVDFDKIEHWAGEGPNRAAFVMSMPCDPDQPELATPVWGFRWADGENPTGFDMLCAIARQASDLAVLVQFTGDMGYTLNGIGYARNIENLIPKLSYDFAGACADSRISFGFYEPNTGMKQTSAPGDATPGLIEAAVQAARESHVIYHPLEAATYGYPAYDYDWWSLDRTACDDPARTYWRSGWYEHGYWSYWLGDADLDNFSYSGLGMSSVTVLDGDVHGWKFMPYDGSGSDEWAALDYTHFSSGTTAVGALETTEASPEEYFRLDGTRLPAKPASPGIYIRRQGSTSTKLIIK